MGREGLPKNGRESFFITLINFLTCGDPDESRLVLLHEFAIPIGRVRSTGAHILIKFGGKGELDCGTTGTRLSEFRYTDMDTIDRKTTLHYLHIQTRLMLGPTFYFS